MRMSSSPCTGRGRSGRQSGTTCWPSRISPNAVRTPRPTSRTRWPRSKPRPSSCWVLGWATTTIRARTAGTASRRTARSPSCPRSPGCSSTPSAGCSAGRRTSIAKSSGSGRSPDLAGRVARGRLTVYLGVIILAEVDLALRVDVSAPSPQAPQPPPQPEHARPYRKIFASYSHRDVEVVRQFELLAASLGDEYLRDIARLHSGADWDEALLRLIDEADVFQLFWSSNSMLSPYVRREWEYAISLARPYFIRPDLLGGSAADLPSSRHCRRIHCDGCTSAGSRPHPKSRPPVPGPMPLQAAAPPPPAPATAAPRKRSRIRAILAPLAITVIAGTAFGGVMLSSLDSRMPRSNRRLPRRRRRRRPDRRARPIQSRRRPGHHGGSNISRRRSSTAATTTRYRMTLRSPRGWSAPFAATRPGKTPRPMSGTSSTPTSRPCPRPSPT